MARKKKRIAVLDLETDPFRYERDLSAFAAGFYDGEYYAQYWGPDCVEYLIDDLRDFDGICYAHNGGKFDFHFMLDFVDPGQVKIINGRIAQIKIGLCTLRDSYLILPVPLSAYKKDDIDYNKFESDQREQHKSEILAYLKTDCLYLYEFVQRFIDEFGPGLTMPGIALKRLEKEGGTVPRTDIAHDNRLRPFYYGGRVSCFESGEIAGPLEFIDINSAYPFAMMHDHPTGQGYRWVSFIPPTRPNHAFYHITGWSSGCFPVRSKTGIDFPVGYGEFKVTGYEYNAAIDTDSFRLDKVITVGIAKETVNYGAFITKYYNLRLEAKAKKDKVYDLFWKLVMNSSYGKLASNPANYREYRLFDENADTDIPGDMKSDFMEYGPYMLYSKPVDPHGPAATYYDVGTAASITGFARAYLWRALCKVDTPIYCDTDSILCKGIGSLQMGDALGEWSEEAQVDRAWIAGKKMYAMEKPGGDYKKASKGVRATVQDIKDAAMGKTVEIKSEAPTFSATRPMTYQKRKIRKTV